MRQQHKLQQQIQQHTALIYAFVLFTSLSVAAAASVVLTGPKLSEGDPCKHASYVGKCVKTSECHTLKPYLKMEALTVHEVPHCNFNIFEEIICCPATEIDTVDSDMPDEVTSTDAVRNGAGSQTVEQNGDTPTRSPISYPYDIFHTNVDYVSAEGGLNASLNPVLVPASGRDSDIAPATSKTARSSWTVPGCEETIGELYARIDGFGEKNRNRKGCRDIDDGRLVAGEPSLSLSTWKQNADGVWEVSEQPPNADLSLPNPIDPGRTDQDNSNGNRDNRNWKFFTSFHDKNTLIFNTNQEYVNTHTNSFAKTSIVTNFVQTFDPINLENGQDKNQGSIDRYLERENVPRVLYKEEPETMELNDRCSSENYSGTCLKLSDCQTHEKLLNEKIYEESDIMRCALGIYEEIICCPDLQQTTEASAATTAGPIMVENSSDPTHIRTPEAPTERPVVNVDAVALSRPSNDTMKKFPYAAAVGFPDEIYQNVEYRCAGILLSSQYLLVPSNCATEGSDQPPTNIILGISSYDYFSEADTLEGGQSTTKDDITVYVMSDTIKETASQRPACIDNNYTQLPRDASFSVTHWGRSDNGFLTGELQETPVQIVEKSACSNNYVNYSVKQTGENRGDAHFCISAGNAKGSTEDLCALGVAGLGSALNIIKQDGSTCVLAITTPMRVCNPTGPILFTALGFYHNFISSIVTPPAYPAV